MRKKAPRGPNDPAPFADPTAQQYLIWLAGRRLIDIPEGAAIRLDGIWSGRGPAAHHILPMPGYGASNVVIMETLDDAGEVVHTQRLATAANGSIPLKAADVLAASGLTKARKPRAVSPPAVEMVEAPAPIEATDGQPAESVNPRQDCQPEAPAVETAPANLSTDVVASLAARIAALEEMVAALSRGDGKSAAPVERAIDRRPARLRIVRRYLAMRALRRRALAQWAIGQVQYDDMKGRAAKADQRAETAEFELSEMRGRLAVATARAEKAEAIATGLTDETHGRLVRLEREVGTWQRRAEAAGWKAPAFQLGALMSGRPPAQAA